MKQYFYFTVLAILMSFTHSDAQTAEDLVRATLTDYIEGTSYTYPERIKKAFYEQANLYLSKEGQDIWIVPAQEYASWFKKEEGTFTGRIGNILFVDVENDIALAKAEILIPEAKLRFVDIFILKRVDNEWKIISKSATRSSSELTGDRVLFVVSNASFYGDSKLPTGNSFSEIVKAYKTFKDNGYTVDFMSPVGGEVSLAYINMADPLHKQYIYDVDLMNALKTTKSPDQITAANYKAVYYVGGGAAMYGVPESEAVQAVVMEIYEKYEGIISSVCHGTAGIVHLKTQDGKYLVKGKKVNGYPDDYENQEADYFKEFPFLIAKTIKERGGKFKKSPRNTPHVEVDGRLVTGQNHLSSELVALKIIEMLKG